MVKKNVSKASRRRLTIFGTISFVIVGYFVYNLVIYSYNLDKLNKEEQKLKTELNALKEDEQYLKTEIEKLNDPEYIARYAREKYQYTKDGEIVIKIDDKIKEQNNQKVKELNIQYIIIGGGLLGMILILYGIRKKNAK